ncbi:hypothetical protein Emag_007619 [Eimeria magna]
MHVPLLRRSKASFMRSNGKRWVTYRLKLYIHRNSNSSSNSNSNSSSNSSSNVIVHSFLGGEELEGRAAPLTPADEVKGPCAYLLACLCNPKTRSSSRDNA